MQRLNTKAGKLETRLAIDFEGCRAESHADVDRDVLSGQLNLL